jgi:hypothetical protein
MHFLPVYKIFLQNPFSSPALQMDDVMKEYKTIPYMVPTPWHLFNAYIIYIQNTRGLITWYCWVENVIVNVTVYCTALFCKEKLNLA